MSDAEEHEGVTGVLEVVGAQRETGMFRDYQALHRTGGVTEHSEVEQPNQAGGHFPGVFQ